MPKTKTSDSSGPFINEERIGKFVVKRFSITAPPASERGNENTFECPLCVVVFKRFSHLKWHLLSMHPRRRNIMQLVKERYRISERDAEMVQSPTLDAHHGQEEPYTCYTQMAEKLQPVGVGKGTATDTFKVPPNFRQKATACPQIKKVQWESSCKESAESLTKKEFMRKTSPNEEGSSWRAYLSSCFSGCVSSEGH